MLTTRARRAERINFQIAGFDFWNFRFRNFRHHRNGTSGRVDTPLRFRSRNTLHSVAARFKLERTVSTVTVHFRDHLFVAAVFRFTR
ncbi:Uncharacterised protein [Vibrio cholerae]|nr:Uncharacterised protein [Vibrio cholerae]